jgi:hypothetical protein
VGSRLQQAARIGVDELADALEHRSGLYRSSDSDAWRGSSASTSIRDPHGKGGRLRTSGTWGAAVRSLSIHRDHCMWMLDR